MITIQDYLLFKGVDVPPYLSRERTVFMDTFMDILLGVPHHCPCCGGHSLTYDVCQSCYEELELYIPERAVAYDTEALGYTDADLPF